MNTSTIFRYEGPTNENYTAGDIYGIYHGKWQRIHSWNEWLILTPLNKQNIFYEVGDKIPTGEELTAFAPFSMLSYSLEERQQAFDINFIPKNQLVIMKDFFNISRFNRILNIKINVEEVEGLIYIALANGTTTSEDYKIFYTFKHLDENSNIINKWIPVLKVKDKDYHFIDENFMEKEYTNDINILGDLTSYKLAQLDTVELDPLLNAASNINPCGATNELSFAFLFVPKRENAQLKIYDINLHTDIKGIWESTQLGVDYTYTYPDETSIEITIKNPGKYKINYLN